MSLIRAIKFLDSATNTPFGVLNIAGRQAVSSVDLLRDITQGNIPGASRWQADGTRNALSVSSYETLWNGPTSLYYYLPSPQQLEVSSSSASDTYGGVGANLVLIQGLAGTGWLYTEETVALGGLSPQTTTTNFIRVLQAFIVHTGTSNTNVGTISIRDSANVNTVCQIDPNYGISLQAVVSIPGDVNAFMENIAVSIASGKVADGQFLYKLNFFATLGLNPMTFIRPEFPIDSSTGQIFFSPPNPFPPMTDIEIRAQASSAGTSASARLEFWWK